MDTGIMYDRNESIEKLRELTKQIPYAMLTTLDPDGELRSRPMTSQQIDDQGNVWFFTGKFTALVDRVEGNHKVNISYASADKNLYVSIAGLATVVDDKIKEKELWKPILKAWFPEGLEDPNLVLLKVQIHSAEYWDTPSSKLVQLAGFAKAILTGKRYESPGENKKIDLN
jgi:general stress protein 26